METPTSPTSEKLSQPATPDTDQHIPQVSITVSDSEPHKVLSEKDVIKTETRSETDSTVNTSETITLSALKEPGINYDLSHITKEEGYTEQESYFIELQRGLANTPENELIAMLEVSSVNINKFDPKTFGFALPDTIEGIDSVKESFVSNAALELWLRKMKDAFTFSKTPYAVRTPEQIKDFKENFPKIQEMAVMLFDDPQIRKDLIDRYPREYKKVQNKEYRSADIVRRNPVSMDGKSLLTAEVTGILRPLNLAQDDAQSEVSKGFLTEIITTSADTSSGEAFARGNETSLRIISNAAYNIINEPDIRKRISSAFSEGSNKTGASTLKDFLHIAQSFEAQEQKAA